MTIEDLIGRTDGYCSDNPPFDEPSECQYKKNSWAAAQGLESVRQHAVLVLVGFAGIWLLAIRFLALWRTA